MSVSAEPLSAKEFSFDIHEDLENRMFLNEGELHVSQ